MFVSNALPPTDFMQIGKSFKLNFTSSSGLTLLRICKLRQQCIKQLMIYFDHIQYSYLQKKPQLISETEIITNLYLFNSMSNVKFTLFLINM